MDYFQKKHPLDSPDTPLLFDQLSFWSSVFGKLLLDHIPVRTGINILDIGCGSGFPLIELGQILGHQSELTGVDIWKEGLARARWKIEKIGLKNITLVDVNADQLPFSDDQFDLIVSNLGINNFEHPPAVMKECLRVLKKKGRIAITTNLQGHFREFYEEYENTLKELKKNDSIKALKMQEKHRGTNESVRELFEDAGFSVVKMIKDRFHMRFANGTALLNHLLVVVGFLPDWRAILTSEEETPVFELLEKKLNERATWEGELKMTVPMLYVEAVK